MASTGPAPERRAARVVRSAATYRLTAILVDRATKRPLTSVRVEAWDATGKCTDLLAVATSDASGNFTMELSRGAASGLLGGRKPAVALRLIPAPPLTQLLETSWRWVLGAATTRARIEVRASATTSPLTATDGVVRGTVRTFRGAPSSGVTVRLSEVGLGSAGVIGEQVSESDGFYEITYTNGGNMDLVVEAFGDERSTERLLARSPRYCHAPPTLRVDLVLGGRLRGPAEYERVVERVEGRITASDITTATAEELSLLACRTGVSVGELETLAAAKQLSAATDLAEDALYGLVRAGLPTDRAAFLVTPPKEIRARLGEALARNVVPASMTGKVELTVDAFRAAALAYIFEPPEVGAPNTFGQVVQSALPDTHAHEAFVSQYLLHDHLEDFWAAVSANALVARAGGVQTARFALLAGALSFAPLSSSADPCAPVPDVLRSNTAVAIDLSGAFHLPLVDKLLADRALGTIGSIQDLARYTDAELTALVDEVGAPQGTIGMSDASRKANYKEHIKTTVRRSFPTVAIAAAIETALPSGHAELTTFFTNPANQTFEFSKTRVAKHLASTTGVLDQIAATDQPAFISQLKAFERLFKLSPDYDQMQALYNSGIHSAAHAHALGVDRLVTMTGLDRAAAQQIVDRACAVAGGALALQSLYGATFNKALHPSAGANAAASGMQTLPDQVSLDTKLGAPLADWEELFGSEGACACEHCHSVFSPAAYLVELLQFLDEIPAGGGTARTALLSDGSDPTVAPRRPDIAKIDLSCGNAETPLPYVDLVNEVLEHVTAAIAAEETTLVYPAHLATTGEARDLLAAPEILDPGPHDAAYAHLASHFYPWNLPFHFWLAEARAFAPQVGVPFHVLAHALQPGGPPTGFEHLPPPYAYDTHRAWERLGLWEKARSILLDTDGVSPEANWGFAASETTWASLLLTADKFLTKTGLSYDALRDLLDTQFIRQFVPDPAEDLNPYLWETGSVVTCDLTKIVIKGLASPLASAWASLHRFLRLQRRLGWTIDETDYAITVLEGSFPLALASGIFTDEGLRMLALVEDFRAGQSLDVSVVLSWFGPLDTRRRGRDKKTSFYERLFQNPSVTSSINAAFNLAAADGPDSPTELAVVSSTLGEHEIAIRAALRLSARDFALLTDSTLAQTCLGEDAVLASSASLNLANLSTLHRIATFARALRLSVQELLSLKRLFGLSSFAPEAFDPSTAYLMAQAAERQRGGGLSASDLLFVLRGLETSGSKLVPADGAAASLAAKLGTALVNVRAGIVGASDPDGEQLLAVLQLLFIDASGAIDTASVALAYSMLATDDPWPLTPPELTASQWFDAYLARYFAHTDAKTRFVTSPGPVAERRAYAFGHLRAFVDGEKAIAQTLGAELRLSPDVAYLLVNQVKDGPSGVPLVELCRLPAYESDVSPTPEAVPTAPPLDDQDVVRIARAAAIPAALKMTAAELVQLCVVSTATPAVERLIDLDDIVNNTSPDVAWFTRWLLTLALWKLRSSLPGGKTDLVAIFPLVAGTENATAILARASTIAEWAKTDVDTLRIHFGFVQPAPTTADVAFALVRIHAALAALGPFETDAQTVVDKWLLLGLGDPAVAAASGASAEIVRAVKARYSDVEWPDVARPLRGQVRDGQRQALVDYLLSTGYAKTPDELYAWLLVDTEMSPCMLTARIKLALGSVQTFVQRALLGLEPGVTLTTEQADRWKALKHYRVWEANRKIFLYPENWLEPALRDDKTPAFKELESELRRQEINDESAEEAFIHYLERVADIANLEIVAMHAESESIYGGLIGAVAGKVTGTVHLIGRTRTIPHEYYYRIGERLTGGRGPRVWTPWDRIDLDITSDHLVLFTYERSLMLAWALIEEKPNEEQPSGENQDDSGAEPPRTDLEIGLAISEHKRGRWTAPRTSLQRLSTALHYRNLTKHGGQVSPTTYNLRGEDLTLALVDRTPSAPNLVCLLNPYRIIQQSASAADLHWPAAQFVQLGSFAIDPCLLSIHAVNSGPFAFQAAEDMTLADAAIAVFNWIIKQLNEDIVEQEEVIKFHQPVAELGNKVAQSAVDAAEALIAADEALIKAYEDAIVVQGALAPVRVTWTTDPSSAIVLCQPALDGDQGWRFRGQVATYEGPSAGEGLFLGAKVEIKDGSQTTPLLFTGRHRGMAVLRPLRLKTTATHDESAAIAEESHWPSPRLTPLVLMHQAGVYLVEPRVDLKVSDGYRLTLLSHPSACTLLTRLRQSGVDGLLNDREIQRTMHDPLALFSIEAGLKERERDAVNFALTSASAVYNWEVFYHAPLYVAARLMAARRFDEARKWLERIFDPTQGIPSGAQKDESWAERPYLYWKPRPLFENKHLASVQQEMALEGQQKPIQLLASAVQNFAALNGLSQTTAKVDLDTQIEAWRKDPFKPYVMARLRTVTFQKTVVIKYVQNLIAWGDELFERDSIESITEATGLYLLARDILGPRPPKIAAVASPPVKTAEELSAVDAFGNALIETESLQEVVDCSACTGAPPPTLLTQYFCVPPNEKLYELWNTIADRLFKIRHCMNIEGVVRELALYEPPIDPALLVQAAAAGVDIDSVLNDLSGTRLPYRYQVLYARAADLAGGVVQLGQSLLSALEKQDGEALSLLRSGQEVDVAKAQRAARALEVKEAGQSLAAAKASVRVIEQRRDHYSSLVTKGQIEDEKASLARAEDAMYVGIGAAGLSALGTAFALVPDLSVVAKVPPDTVTRVMGGDKLGLWLSLAADAARTTGSVLQYESTRLATKASYSRRVEDWRFQVQSAQAELTQSAKQVAAAEIRLAIAQASLDTHDLQIDNAKSVDEYMRSKLTNDDLYEWMSDRLMDVYYEAYKLGYDMAKRAEKAMRAELALADDEPRFVTFGYWDSAKKGLTSGEHLQQALRALDVAYHERNRRELEITKQISLLSLAPEELVKLRETGTCEVTLGEEQFDYDYPGHYLRRIKSASITIPSVTGPYTSVHCTLTLLNNRMRKNALVGGGYEETTPAPDNRFAYDVVPIQSVVTSSGQNDAGVFEVALRDDRYLPFEGAGAISTWRIELPALTNGFDISAIADLILHLRYTAKDGGEAMATASKDAVVGMKREGRQRLISLRTELPVEWDAFMNPTGEDPPTLAFTLTQAMFAYLHGSNPIDATGVRVLVKWSVPEIYYDTESTPLDVSVTLPGEVDPPSFADQALDIGTYGQLATVELPIQPEPAAEPLATTPALGSWTIVATNVESLPSALQTDGRFNETLLDMWLLVTYEQDVPEPS